MHTKEYKTWGRTALAAVTVAAFLGAPLTAVAEPSAPQTMAAIMATFKSSEAMSAVKHYEGFWDPSFRKLDTDNSKLMDGEDVLDSDPVCQCQDVGGVYHYTGKLTAPDRYVATVSRDGDKATWQVILKKLKGGWKIYDVVDDQGSIRGKLERHNACARNKLAHHQKPDSCTDLK
jgi:hypothetical protein